LKGGKVAKGNEAVFKGRLTMESGWYLKHGVKNLAQRAVKEHHRKLWLACRLG